VEHHVMQNPDHKHNIDQSMPSLTNTFLTPAYHCDPYVDASRYGNYFWFLWVEL
jgi:hypothetical protein